MMTTKESSTDDQGSRNRGFTSSSDSGTTKKDASSQDSKPESGTNQQVQTTDEIMGQSRFTAEQLRQQAQRDETQAFLDQQEEGRQMMAAQTKAREEFQKKVNQRNQQQQAKAQQQQQTGQTQKK